MLKRCLMGIAALGLTGMFAMPVAFGDDCDPGEGDPVFIQRDKRSVLRVLARVNAKEKKVQRTSLRKRTAKIRLASATRVRQSK